MRSRLVNLIAAIAAGLVFLAGLIVSGVAGAVLLVAVAALLIVLSSSAWPSIPSRGRVVRVVIVAAVLAIAVIKIATR